MRASLAGAFFLAGAFCVTFADGLAAPAFGVATFADFASRSCAAAKLFCKLLIMVDLSRFARERSIHLRLQILFHLRKGGELIL